ncbi:MAG: substrate-binding domain-containing protein [Clostridia bacterium]|nr:substrate-binding domain-containing protein [Clostridia bacterium]
MKKVLSVLLALVAVLALASCSGANNDKITVITREDGSGTRGAFMELFEIEEIIATAEVSQSTTVVMTSVSTNPSAIGYISLGSLDGSVKALKIDGADASVENIKNGSYKISRPFNVATKGELSALASDFLAYILSEEGQKVVEDNGYVTVGNNGAYSGGNMTGKIVITGSSSVKPVMEKLKEAYMALNPDAEISLMQSDSSNGMKSVADGLCDIGMASRELKSSELEQGLDATSIAIDGVAVIVNKDSGVTDLTSEQIRKIYSGEITLWSELAQ